MATVDKKHLVNALNRVTKVTNQYQKIYDDALLTQVRLHRRGDALMFTCRLWNDVVLSFGVPGDFSDWGDADIILNPLPLFKTLKKIKDKQVVLRVSDGKLLVQWGKGNIALPYQPAADVVDDIAFPDPPAEKCSFVGIVNAEDLNRVCRFGKGFIGENEATQNINIEFDNKAGTVRVTATDGYILGCHSTSADVSNYFNGVVTPRITDYLPDGGKLRVSVCEGEKDKKWLLFQGVGVPFKMYIMLVEIKYPGWRHILENYNSELGVQFNRLEMLRAIECFSGVEMLTRITITENSIKLAGSDSNAEVTISCVSVGKNVWNGKITMLTKRLTDVLRWLSADDIVMWYIPDDKPHPLLFSPAGNYADDWLSFIEQGKDYQIALAMPAKD